MQSDVPACACLNVKYDPILMKDGSKSARWTCVLCGAEFIKIAEVMEAAQGVSEAIERAIKQEFGT